MWSNIQTAAQDPEVGIINEFEEKLGELPDHINKIRELITRLEVCHFKCEHHIEKIIDSILTLAPKVAPEKIGINHIQHGENAWKNDLTGKSLLGQQYIWAMKSWIEDIPTKNVPGKYDKEIGQKVRGWLGNKQAYKIRLVRLLLARLTWDWTPYEELQRGGEYEELEFQICRMDICHYAFPTNLERMLIGIGQMRPIENFEGCGSFNVDIQEFVKKKLIVLSDLFESLHNNDTSDNSSQTKAWLTACLIKTLKAQVDLSEPSIEFN
jgi:hypothetical protein